MAVLEIERLASEEAERGGETLFGAGLLRPPPRCGAQFGFDGFKVAVEVCFAAGLLARGIGGQKGGRCRIGLAPPIEKAGHDGVPFAWHISELCYADLARDVPWQ